MNTESITIISGMQSEIQTLQEDEALYEETNFDNRADAIDFINFHIIDRIEGLQQKVEPKKKLDILKQRAEKVKFELEKIDINLFMQLREKIRTGIYTTSSFKKIINKYLRNYASNIDHPGKVGYDNLDVFMNGLISEQDIPQATMDRRPGMVFFQKTPARIIFEMVELAELTQDDVFFDVGSGLGQVAILVNLLCGATTKGIEYESAYCNYAKTCASQLHLSQVEFINGDALNWDYTQGTIFFMYTPFEGSMLQDMLEIFQIESQKRMIRIFTYGPCSLLVARQSWLYCVNRKVDDTYKLYEFRSLDAVSTILHTKDIKLKDHNDLSIG